MRNTALQSVYTFTAFVFTAFAFTTVLTKAEAGEIDPSYRAKTSHSLATLNLAPTVEKSLFNQSKITESLENANQSNYSLLQSNCLHHQATQLTGDQSEDVLNSNLALSSERPESVSLGFLPSPLAMLIAPKFGQVGLYGEPLGGGPIGNEPTGTYNVEIGPLKFRFSVSGGIMFNDNVGLSRNKQSDFINQIAFGINGFWDISQFNTLEIAFRISYKKYLKYSDLDIFEFTLLPGAESDVDQFQFIMLINKLTLTFYDRVNLQSDPFGYAALDNISEFVRFQNTLGMDGVYDLTDVKLFGAYEHGWIRIIAPDGLKHLDRSFDLLSGRVSGDITTWFNMGFGISYVNTRFVRTDLRSNSHTFSYGPSFDVKPSENIQFLATILRTFSRFGDTGITGRLGQSDTNMTSSNLKLTHQLNETMQHSITYTRTMRPGLDIRADHLKTKNFNYTYHWYMNDNLMLTGSYNYNIGIEQLRPEYHRQDVRLGVLYTIPPSWTIEASYTHAIKDSDDEENDYRRNTLGINTIYKF